MNRIREWFSNGFITIKAVDAYTYLSTAYIAAPNSISVSSELSIGMLFIIGADGVAVVVTFVGVDVSIGVCIGVNNPMVYYPY